MDSEMTERLIDMAQSGSNEGICMDCGEEHFEVEPDARKYLCESCGKKAVYGAEEALLMFG
jgi:DNA-directed RNA polymerase subunit RPC12/RpoP